MDSLDFILVYHSDPYPVTLEWNDQWSSWHFAGPPLELWGVPTFSNVIVVQGQTTGEPFVIASIVGGVVGNVRSDPQIALSIPEPPGWLMFFVLCVALITHRRH